MATDELNKRGDHEVAARAAWKSWPLDELPVGTGHAAPVPIAASEEKLTVQKMIRAREHILGITTLPESSAERKDYPILEGVLKYFPAAIASVARISKIGNDKHNGVGTPLHHARGKSMDHGDCILRHLMDLFEDRGHGVGYDEGGVPQAAYIAWRALALAQEWFEKNEGAPLAPNAKES